MKQVSSSCLNPSCPVGSMKLGLAGLFLMTILMLMGVGTAEAIEWSEPIELTHVRNWNLWHEFEAALDSHGNLHLVYSVASYQDSLGDRMLYSIFDPEGNQIGQTRIPMGEDRLSTHGRILIDSADQVHIMSLAQDEDGIYWHSYMSYTPDFEVAVEPFSFPGLPPTGDYWQFFQRTDRTFILTMLASHYEEDPPYRPWKEIFYVRFDSTGQIFGEPHSLYSDHNSEENFHRLKASLDPEDNLHLVWRSATVNNQMNRPAYACVSPEDEIITDLTYIPARYNPNHTGCGRFFAQSLDEIYLLMVDPADAYPYDDYVQKMNHRCEMQWFKSVLVQPNFQRSINMSMSDTLLNISGAYSPDTSRILKWFYSSISVDSNVVDSIDIIRPIGRNYGDPLILRRGENIYFLHYEVFRGTERGIMLIRNRLPDHVVEDDHNSKKFFSLISAYPNPFNSSTTIRYSTGSAAHPRRLAVYDLSGRVVTELLGNTAVTSPQVTEKEAVTHGGMTAERTVVWDASLIPAGIYFIRLEAGREVVSRKAVLMK